MTPATLTSAPTNARLGLLDRHIAGRIVTPESHDYDECRRGWNLSVELHPAAIAYPESADDVVSDVYFANEHGLRIAPQGTGHGAHGLEDARRRDRRQDRAHARRRDQPRAPAPPSSRPAPSGSTSSSPPPSTDSPPSRARRPTSASSATRSAAAWAGSAASTASPPTTSARHPARRRRRAASIRADHEHHAELFWALRGGGGSFGIVTAIEVELFEHAEAYAGTLFFGAERAAEVLKAYVAWTQTTPDDVSASGRILRFPDLEIVPEPMRGRAFAAVEAVYAAPAARPRAPRSSRRCARWAPRSTRSRSSRCPR